MPSDPVLVVGVCPPERRRYARDLAASTGRAHQFWRGEPDPRHPIVVDVARDPHAAEYAVVEIATDVSVLHLEPALREPAAPVVCVVDARHLLDDLGDDSALIDRALPGDDRGDVGARARQAAALVEAASLVCIVEWEHVDTAALALQMALISHLNPRARVRLSRGAADDAHALAVPDGFPCMLERAGWVCALNDEHDPYMTDRRVRTLRYERLRPFHPGRLVAALDEIEQNSFGWMLRSSGFCRLATRAGTLARWDHVGSAMWIDPLTDDPESSATGQDLAITGLDLHPVELVAALDAALVTDAELAGGPAVWARFADPLPEWPAFRENRARE